MLQGLHLMERAELGEIAKLTRMENKAREAMNEDQLRRHILNWAGKVVGCSSSDPLVIERACLTWSAKHWHVDTEGLDDTDELERALRIRIAEDAATFLSPLWWVACALSAAGPADALMPKIRLLDKAASLVVPSRSARQKLAQQWLEKGQEWGITGHTQPEVVAAIEQMRKSPETIEQALTLALVISLADGRLSMEEERILRHIADESGYGHEASGELVRKVNAMYWGHQVEVAPKRGGDDPHTEKLTAMQAAQRTLDSAGTLEGMCLEACDKVVRGNEPETPEQNAPKSGWQRVLGSVSGLKQFFNNRMRSDEQVNLVRLVYLSIIHQHAEAAGKAEVAARKARELASANAPSSVVAAAPSLGEVGAKGQSRVIKLD